MNKTDLVNEISKKSNLTKKDSEAALNATIESISETLSRKEKVQLVGFGTFETRKRAERKGRNPTTGKEMKIPAQHVPAFKPGKALKEKVK